MDIVEKYNVCKKCLLKSDKPCIKSENCNPENKYKHFIDEDTCRDFNGNIVSTSNQKPQNNQNPQPIGLRFNEGKRKWSLVDFDSLEDMVKVLEFGAVKYGEYNWQKGLKTTGIIESMLRHVFSYLNGEDNDKESGISHIGHIQCNAMFLAYMQKNKPELDSRRLKNINQNNYSCDNSKSCNESNRINNHNNIDSNSININQSNEPIQKNEIDKEQRKELNKE